jgi:hypothetical protein
LTADPAIQQVIVVLLNIVEQQASQIEALELKNRGIREKTLENRSRQSPKRETECPESLPEGA